MAPNSRAAGDAFRQLHVVFGTSGLVAGGHAAVHPLGLVEKLPGAHHLLRRSIHQE